METKDDVIFYNDKIKHLIYIFVTSHLANIYRDEPVSNLSEEENSRDSTAKHARLW